MWSEYQEDMLSGTEIAVIGMAGRYPEAPDIKTFWNNLVQGKETIRFFSEDELVESGVDPQLVKNPLFVKAKGILEDIDYFDASFFNYTIAEAEVMDPQLRLLHECSWAALEDAGYEPDNFDGFIGYYIGASTHLYWISRMLKFAAGLSENFAAIAVNDGYSFSTQVAYRLNLKGPAITMQTACSTSLVTIHSACQALLSGECDMALAGGIAVTLPWKNGYLYQEGMVYSPDGHCRPFDSGAAGSLNGNGIGIVVLKPMENAIQDRDHIYAMVKGTAVNNDGNRKIGYSAPSVKGQAEVIRIAQQAAEVELESITYIEAHGTGTALGDPVEIRALTQAFSSNKKQFCRLGSVKSNMGHLDAAAGVTGFIKTVLALYHHQIPPTLHFNSPNREIDFANSPFLVNTELYKWERIDLSIPLRAGVSSFGIGGTNAHVILEETPVALRQKKDELQPPQEDYQLIQISGKSRAALERNTQNLIEFFNKNPGTDLADAAYTLQVGRKAFEHRRVLVCQNSSTLNQYLSSVESKKVVTHTPSMINPPVVFVFPGLGGQYVNMGLELYQKEPVFQQELDRCFQYLEPLTGYDLKEILFPPSNLSVPSVSSVAKSKDINHPEVSQLVIFIYEYALASLLMAWGISPNAMIGYSFGEYTAACIAGVFSLEDALSLIVQRGKLIEKTQPGAMISIPLIKEQLRPVLEQFPGVSLAIDNGDSCIASGPVDDIEALSRRLKEMKYICMRVNTGHALHSDVMKPILSEFTGRVGEITLNKPSIPYISNVTGQWQTDKDIEDPAYWGRHLSGTVQFAKGIGELVTEPHSIFLELGPGREMTTMIKRYLNENQQVLNLVSPQQKQLPDSVYLLERLGRLWSWGIRIDWRAFYSTKNEQRFRLSLPTYSFERQRFNLGEGESASPVRGPDQPEDKPMFRGITYKRTDVPEDYIAPGNKIEQSLTEAFEQIFAFEPIGITEDFFELGGDSLKVITLVTRLHKDIGVEVPMEEVFKRPTVKDLAVYIEERTGENKFLAIPPVEKKEYYPLSPSQRRLFIMEQMEENTMAYNMPTVLWMDGTPDIERLGMACRQLMERHESLRTGFILKGTEPVQRVFASENIPFEMEYLEEQLEISPDGRESQNECNRESAIKKLIDDFVQPFDLSVPPLWKVRVVKLSEQKYLLMQNIHHIITDDISTGIMISDLSVLYRGEAKSLPAIAVQYKDYAVWQKQSVAEQMLINQQMYWQAMYSTPGGIPQLQLPYDFDRPQVWTYQGAHIQLTIPKELTAQLHDLANKNKTTLFVLLFAIYNTLLHSYSGQEDIVVGTPITGRSHRDIQQVAGMFVNTLALRNRPKPELSFTTFLKQIKTSTLDAFSNQLYQFDDLVEHLNLKRDLSRNPLFDTMFVLHTVDLGKVNIPGVILSPYEYDTPVSRFDLTLNTAETVTNEINLVLEYSTALFKPSTAEGLMTDFITVLKTVIGDPQVALGEIETHAAQVRVEEKKRILFEFNDTKANFPHDKTLKILIEEQVMRSPDHSALTAVNHLTEKTGTDVPSNTNSSNRNITLTYHSLNEEANRISAQLRVNGAGRGTIIALLTDRNVQMIAGLIAILKTGAAYLPIGPEYPADRVRYMVEQTGTPIILTTEPELPFQHKAKLIKIERESSSDTILEKENNPGDGLPTDLAYVIYTSGTTGKPKGVMVEQRSVANFITGITTIIPFTGNQHILSLTTLAFDIFGLETLIPLITGTWITMGDLEAQLDANTAAAIIEKEQITILQMTPSRLKLFLEQPKFSHSMMRLTYLLIGGEALPWPLLEKARKLTDAMIYNLYGPTETTIWSTIKDVSAGEVLNIGRPLANTQIYIVDITGGKYLQPIGIAGELLIGGDGVARGYLDNPELTADRFINPYTIIDLKKVAPEIHCFSSTIYRTGDLARWLSDGNIEFMGRSDHQMKIRGNRVEPEEIETLIVSHQSVKEAVIIAKDDENGDTTLWAYLETEKDCQLEIPELREFLSGKLPDYMMPAHFMQVPQIPLTLNGKVDRKALNNMKGTLITARTTFVEPQNQLEESIAEIWRQVLNIDKVSIDDNFLDLGGTSLKVILAVNQLKTYLNKNIPVVTMFRYPTIRTLANYIGQSAGETVGKDRSNIKAKGRERMMMKRRIKDNSGK